LFICLSNINTLLSFLSSKYFSAAAVNFLHKISRPPINVWFNSAIPGVIICPHKKSFSWRNPNKHTYNRCFVETTCIVVKLKVLIIHNCYNSITNSQQAQLNSNNFHKKLIVWMLSNMYIKKMRFILFEFWLDANSNLSIIRLLYFLENREVEVFRQITHTFPARKAAWKSYSAK